MGNAIIFEIKITDTFSKMEENYRYALVQIEERNYAAELESGGCSKSVKYGVYFFKKMYRQKGIMIMIYQ